MTYLLHTDSVADWLNRQTSVASTLAALPGDELAISIITHRETLEGILGGRNPRSGQTR
ncbi:MAG: hypothetical protein ACRDJE_22425 [Dehalococcoidia bacterium]